MQTEGQGNGSDGVGAVDEEFVKLPLHQALELKMLSINLAMATLILHENATKENAENLHVINDRISEVLGYPGLKVIDANQNGVSFAVPDEGIADHNG